ncbi:GNAT family N-acetyltransferase [Terrisporobacter petrolearius]|uniref:GNAT family N-acetyltransferase n=1 Tax=Terrisporobacter petrolearius TaxID=1460447 RepID=UPI003B00D156
MEIKKLKGYDISEALDLVLNVFMQYEAPDYSQRGIETFKECINDVKWVGSLEWFGAYKDKLLIGIIATRNEGNHIALFFVKGEYHKQGIGRKLFEIVIENSTRDWITVNSSPYAIEVYKHFGFSPIQEEQITDGIRYTPMLFTK